MAALVESGMTNLRPSGADSLGYFQIPARIWNKGEYAGALNEFKKVIDDEISRADKLIANRVTRRVELYDLGADPLDLALELVARREVQKGADPGVLGYRSEH
jgi:hypothetical protein